MHARHGLRLLVALGLTFGLLANTYAALNLTLNQVTDISALQFGGVGGLAFDPGSGSLWIADAAGAAGGPVPGSTNRVALVNPLTAAVTTVFDAASGNVFLGPDAIAFNVALNELFLFSAFVDRTAGVTTTAGVTVRSLAIDPRQYAGAAFSAGGELWVVDREQQTFNPDFLVRLDPLTGSPLGQVEITGATFNPNLSGLAFDPVTGRAVAYDTDQQVLLEIDLGTGMVLGETAVGGFFTIFSVPGGIAFNSSGDTLYLGSGVGLSHPTGIVSELVVLNRFAGVAVPLPAPLALLALGSAAVIGWRRRAGPILQV